MNDPKILHLNSGLFNWYIPPEIKEFNGKKEVGKKASVDYMLFLEYLERYFLKNYEGDTIKYYEIRQNVLYDSNVDKMSDFVFEHIKQEKRKDIKQVISSPGFRGFTPKQIAKIHTIEPDIMRDTRDTTFLLYQNGFLSIKKDSSKFHHYSEMSPGLFVYENQFCRDTKGNPRLFDNDLYNKDKDFKKSIFYKFIHNVMGEDEEKTKSLMSAIGYLVNNHKRPDLNKAVVLFDREYSDSPNGRTGKSLIMKSIGYCRNLNIENGKNFDFENRFAFQSLSSSTQILLIDDIRKFFNVEDLYVLLTDKFKIERKNQSPVILDNPPKMALTTNYSIKTTGDSSRARVAEYPIHKVFSASYTPKDRFGKNFFSEFDLEDWFQFDLFIIECSRIFHSEGLIEIHDNESAETKLMYDLGEELLEFLDNRFRPLIENEINEEKISRTKLRNEYLEKAESAKSSDFKTFQKTTLFNLKLDQFLSARDLYYTSKDETGKFLKTNGERVILIRNNFPKTTKRNSPGTPLLNVKFE